MSELLSLGASKPAQPSPRRGIIGIRNVSLSVTDLDDTYRRITEAGYEPDQMGLYCVAVMLIALVAARRLATDPQRVCAASLPARMT